METNCLHQLITMPEKRYIVMRHFDLRRKFVPITHVERCIDWIDRQKKYSGVVLSDIKQYNQENLHEAHKLLEQKSQNDSNIYRELVLENEDESKKHDHQSNKIVIHEYSRLLEENIKNLRTLKTFLEISLLENPLGEMSQRIDRTAVSVVEDIRKKSSSINFEEEPTQLRSSNISECLCELGEMKSSWSWVEELLKCLVIHIRQASKYCQFHHQMHLVLESLTKFRSTLDLHQSYDDSYSSALRLAGEIQAAEVGIEALKEKVGELTTMFRNVVPMRSRTLASQEKMPGVLLCKYSTKEVELRPGEEVTIVDRSLLYAWKIKTNVGVCVTIPSIIVGIVGHDKDSLPSLVRLHRCMEETIEFCVEKLSERLTSFLLKVFRESYTSEEVRLIKSLDSTTKKSLLSFFDSVGKSVPARRPEGYGELEGRLVGLRKLLEVRLDVGDDPEDGNYGKALVVQLNVLQYLLESFQGLQLTSVEMSESLDSLQGGIPASLEGDRPALLEDVLDTEEVIARMDEIISNSRMLEKDTRDSGKQKQKMETVCFVDHVRGLSEFARDLEIPSKLHKGSPRPTLRQQSTADSFCEEVFYGHSVLHQRATSKRVHDPDIVSGVKISETEHLFAAQSEENKRFIIRSVVDPENGTEISLSDAIGRGIVDASGGTYLVSVAPRETMSIAAAMHQNLIKVQSTTVRKSSEKKSSVGLVTVKVLPSNREHRGPVDKVFDTSTGSKVGLGEAERLGLIDVDRNVFRDAKNKRNYSLDEAEVRGWILRSEGSGRDGVDGGTKVTYVVWGVLDRRRGKMLPFHDACREGLMDRETATYFDLLSGRKHGIEEAIGLEFVKAEVVKDPKSVDLWREA